MRMTILTLGLLMASPAGAVSADYVEESISKAAKEVGVPAELLKAICVSESNLNTKAFVYADGGTQNHAFGMCQVLIKTAEDYGLKNHNCNDNFSYRPEDRTHENCKLFGAYTNALYAAKYLKYQLDRYGGSWINAIAAYNSGTVKLCKTGWVKNARGEKLYRCEKGGLLNQRYVDRVLKALQGDNNEQRSRPKPVQKEKATGSYSIADAWDNAIRVSPDWENHGESESK
jgi:hypothetical protein